MSHNKQRMTGEATTTTANQNGIQQDNLPRQNIERDNAIVGAQGGSKYF